MLSWSDLLGGMTSVGGLGLDGFGVVLGKCFQDAPGRTRGGRAGLREESLV